MTLARQSSSSQVLASGAIGGAIAAVANVVVYIIATSVLAISLQIAMPPDMATLGELPFPMVIIASFVPGIFAALVYLLFQRLMPAQAKRNFLILAVVILVFSFFPLITMPGVADSVKLVLGVMHIVAAVAIAGVLALRNS